jgi:serine/threonine protein kinase
MPPLDSDGLYVKALALISKVFTMSEAERESVLDRECADSDALKAEVQWMLREMQSPEDPRFLEGAVRARQESPAGHVLTAGERGYEIIRTLGEGGMGVVYLARRVDGDYSYEVALKLLNLIGMAMPIAMSRFISERRILAELKHPNIARLVDGGTFADGRPFLAMEYVEGMHIVEYCRTHDLPLRLRLGLFQKVCKAVQYAHQRLVIHRDLKPENILVTADGEPKLLDFGISQLMESGPVDNRTRTGAGLRVMTLAYASPEQISGEALSTATDIFSLGIVLTEVLTGYRPWQDESPIQLAKAICELEPKSPSDLLRQATRSDGRTGRWRRWLRRSVAGSDADLDAIVLMALRKEPNQRYGSVREFEHDISNYIQFKPVQARQGQIAYKARKYLRRNRAALAWVSIVLLLLMTFGYDRQVQLIRTRSERNRSEQTQELLLSMFAVDPDEKTAGTLTPEALLDRGLKKINENSSIDVLTHAEALNAIAGGYFRWKKIPKAVATYDAAWKLLDSSNETVPRLRVAVAIGSAEATTQSGEVAVAEHWYNEAYSLATQYFGANSREALNIEKEKASFLQGWTSHRWNEIKALLDHASQTFLERFGEDDPGTISAQMHMIRYIWEHEGRPASAAKMYASLLTRVERDPGRFKSLSIIPLRADYAETLLDSGEVDRADQQNDLVIEESRAATGPNSQLVLRALLVRIQIALAAGNMTRAGTTADAAIDVLRKLETNIDSIQQIYLYDASSRAFSRSEPYRTRAVAAADKAVAISEGEPSLSPVIKALAFSAKANALFYADGNVLAAQSAIDRSLEEGKNFDEGAVNINLLVRCYVLAAIISDAANDLESAEQYAQTAMAKAGHSMLIPMIVHFYYLQAQHKNAAADQTRSEIAVQLSKLDVTRCSEDARMAADLMERHSHQDTLGRNPLEACAK